MWYNPENPINMKKEQNLLGTCDLTQADIAFFPMVNSSISEQLFCALDKKSLQGVVSLPPIAANRLGIWLRSDKTFILKNVPLEFRLFDHNFRLSSEEVDEFYNSLMFYVQKNAFPVIWIIAPRYMCEHIYKTCLKGNAGNFYYHDSLEKKEDKYFTVSKAKYLEVHPLPHAKIFPVN